MALTEQQQTSVLQVVQALFAATPGAVYLKEFDSLLTSGASVADLAQTLSEAPVFLGKTYTSDMSPEAFADDFLKDLIGNSASEVNINQAKSDIVNKMKNGASQDSIIVEWLHQLSITPTSNLQWGDAAKNHLIESVTKIVDNLVGDSITIEDKASAVDFMVSEVEKGQSLGTMIEWATNALDGVSYSDSTWGSAAQRFDNRMEVSRYYSIEKNGQAIDLLALQKIIADVTSDPASVTAAKGIVDGMLSQATFDLATLDGSNGFRLDGVMVGDRVADNVSSAGDVNGDGYDDMLISSSHPFSEAYTGSVFVVFGKASGFETASPLSVLDGNTGFRINGAVVGENAGMAINSAGDINDDGFDDIIIGAPAPRDGDVGSSYVVFGKANGFDSTLNLSTLDGTNGFRMIGTLSALTGWAVSGAGDVNGDGFDDAIVGACFANTNGRHSGDSYIIFGKASGFDASIALSELNGENGFHISSMEGSSLGNGVSGGDFNGDGFSDLYIGAYGSVGENGETTGSSYVVFGKSSGFGSSLDLSQLNGSDGFRIDGMNGDYSGYTISTTGDVNGDGFDDMLITIAPWSETTDGAGGAYVVFGKSTEISPVFNLSELDGLNGFRIQGNAPGDGFGQFLNKAGDFNGDGFDEIILGAYASDTSNLDAGSAYVIYGKASGFQAQVNVSNLNSKDGFIINGINSGDALGDSISGAGDVNKDGFDDLIIGAQYADTDGGVNSGAAYVLFGSNSGISAQPTNKTMQSNLDLTSYDNNNLLQVELIGV